MKWKAQAPANLALIKYMGKKDHEKNIPLNPSLSFTLHHFITKVEIEEAPAEDLWRPLQTESEFQTDLSGPAKKRFTDFFKYLKQRFAVPGYYEIRSGNNFPLSAGAASSASSFAALTKAVYKLALSKSASFKRLSVQQKAQVSRRGSGSSCRSFFSPWALWTEKNVCALQFPFKKLIHQMIITEDSEKHTPSRQAHRLAETGPHFKGRPERAHKRLKKLCSALNDKDWRRCFLLVRAEFLDMHRLFETARPPFSYQTKGSARILKQTEIFWKMQGDGPLLTMDAGSAVHLLYRTDQNRQAKRLAADLCLKKTGYGDNIFQLKNSDRNG